MGDNFWRLFTTFNIKERIDKAVCDVLDKITAEIEKKANDCDLTLGIAVDDYEWGKHNAYTCVLHIIDKYRKELE